MRINNPNITKETLKEKIYKEIGGVHGDYNKLSEILDKTGWKYWRGINQSYETRPYTISFSFRENITQQEIIELYYKL